MYLFTKLRSYINSFFMFIPNYVSQKAHSIKTNIEGLKYTISHLTEVNMELGLYHLFNNNLNDAIFRFYLINKLYDKNNQISYYWLGWAYILKNNYQKALKALNMSSTDESAELKRFIENIDSIEKIPESLNSLYRNLVAVKFFDKISDGENNIVTILTNELTNIINKIVKKNTILELGSNVGVFGNEISKKIQNEYKIIGVEPSIDMTKMSDNYFPGKKLYDSNINESIKKFLESDKNIDYDIIVSISGISFQKNIKALLSDIIGKLKHGGYLAICLNVAKHTKFQLKNFEFAYKTEEILDILSLLNCEIKFERDLTIFKKYQYYLIICSKV